MLLLFTLGMLILTLWTFKNSVFPNLEKLVTSREQFVAEASKDSNYVHIWAFSFLVIIFLFAGFHAIYLGFAVNFLLAKGVLLAKVAAFAAAGLFLIGLLTIGRLLTRMFKNVNDPTAFRDVILPLPTLSKQVYTFIVQTIWIAFYVILVFFLLQ